MCSAFPLRLFIPRRFENGAGGVWGRGERDGPGLRTARSAPPYSACGGAGKRRRTFLAKGAKRYGEKTELRQRKHNEPQGRRPRAAAPGGHLRLGRPRRLRARDLRNSLELDRRGAAGLRQGDHRYTLPRPVDRGGGPRPRHPGRLQQARGALQLGACFLRDVRGRQVQQQRRRQLRLRARPQRPWPLRHAVCLGIYGRGHPLRRLPLHAAFRARRERRRPAEGAVREEGYRP